MDVYKVWVTQYCQPFDVVAMKIVSWKLVAYDEDDNEIVVDVHRNHVANLIDDFLTESFGEESDDGES